MGGRYPQLANVAWDVVRRFACEWQQTPYLWWTERDVHAELASRLRAAMRGEGAEYVEAKYEGMLTGVPHTWSRVACEPCLRVDGEVYYPDLVIWADASKRNPPDAERGENWSVLWCCEIKCRTSLKPESASDLDKLRTLIAAGVVHYGGWLQLQLRHPDADEVERTAVPAWMQDRDRRLWILDVCVPRPDTPAG